MSRGLFNILKWNEKKKRKEEALYKETKKRIKIKDSDWLGSFLDKFSKGEKMDSLVRNKAEKDDWL